MKVFVRFTVVIFLIVCLAGCSSRAANNKPTGKELPSDLLQVADNVHFKEGSGAEGIMILTKEDIKGFTYEYSDSNKCYQYQFVLTEKGKELFSTATTEILKKHGTISLWIGDEMIFSPTINAPITGGIFIMTSKLDEKGSLDISEKLQGKSAH